MNGFKVITGSISSSEKEEHLRPLMDTVLESGDRLSQMVSEVSRRAETESPSHNFDHYLDFTSNIKKADPTKLLHAMWTYATGPDEKDAVNYSNVLKALHEHHFIMHDLHNMLHEKCGSNCTLDSRKEDCPVCTLGCALCSGMNSIPSDPHKTSSLIFTILEIVKEDENYAKIASHPLVKDYLDFNANIYNTVIKLINRPESLNKIANYKNVTMQKEARQYVAKIDESITYLSSLDVELSNRLSSFLSANFDNADVLNSFNKWAIENIPLTMKMSHKALHDCYEAIGEKVSNCQYC